MLSPRDATIAVSMIGSMSVLFSYYQVFASESEGYIRSRYWLGIREDNVRAIVPLQIAAAIGFVVFLIAVINEPPQKGILSYANGYSTAMILAMFFVSSTMWTYTIKSHLDNPQHLSWVGPSASLVVAALSAILITAGVFEDDSSTQYKILGALAFATVVTMVDAVGWNSRLIMHSTIGNPNI